MFIFLFIFIDFSFELNISNNMLQKINFPSVSLEDSILRQSELKEKENANYSLEREKNTNIKKKPNKEFYFALK